MDYVILIHRAEEGGYWAEAPSLDGCFAQGETLDDLLEDAANAIASHLAARASEGLPPPDAPTLATVRVDDR